MNGKDFVKHFVLVVAFMMVFSVATFADTTVVTEEEPVTAFVTVMLNDTYAMTVDAVGTVLDVEKDGEVFDDSVTYEFDEDDNVIEVVPPHPYEDLLGLNVKVVIEVLNDPEILEFEFTVVSESTELTDAITAMINGDLEEPLEDAFEEEMNPNAERFEMAKEFGITPGRMNILERLAAVSGEDFNYTDWIDVDVSMKDIQLEIKDNSKKIQTFREGYVECPEEGSEEVEVEEKVVVEDEEVEEVEEDDDSEKPVKSSKKDKTRVKGKGKK